MHPRIEDAARTDGGTSARLDLRRSGAAEISVVMPARNEAAIIEASVRDLREYGVREIVLVDGGSKDDTCERATPWVDQVLQSPPGRARQMNAGAAATTGDILLFLHADTRMPVGYANEILDALEDSEVIGGRFDVELAADGLAYRVISRMISLRSRWSRVFTGDQGIFIKRDCFEQLGGFPEIPLMEDLALSIAMKRTGRIACLRARVRTSARRWQEDGVVRTVLLMWKIRALYFLGVAPNRLAEMYRRKTTI